MELPSFIIADLYKHSLVEIDPGNKILHLKDDISLKVINDGTDETYDNEHIYLGNNLGLVSIVVSEVEAKIINATDLIFLTNILKACKLTEKDIAIVNQLKTPVTYSYLKEELHAKYILIFGIEPTEIKLPFIIPHFQVQQYAGCTIVIAPPLSEMNREDGNGKLLRTKLWMSLQRCFNLEQPIKK